MLWSWVFHIFFLLVCYIHSMTACTYKNYQESMNSTCRRYYELQKPSHSIWSLMSQKIKRILLAVHWMHTVTELSYYVIKSRQRNTTILPQWNTYQEKYSWFMKTWWNIMVPKTLTNPRPQQEYLLQVLFYSSLGAWCHWMYVPAEAYCHSLFNVT